MADSRWVWLGFCTHSTALSLTNRLRALPSQLWPCCLELHLSGSSASSGPLTQQAGDNWVPTLPRSASMVIWAFMTSFPSTFPDTISFPFLIDWFGSFYICTHCIDPWLLVWFCDPPVWSLDWSYPLEPSRSPASMQREQWFSFPLILSVDSSPVRCPGREPTLSLILYPRDWGRPQRGQGDSCLIILLSMIW